MEVHVLASSSKGNAAAVKFDKVNILVDAGISARRIVDGLTGAGIAVEDLAGIFITHEHTDHVKGLPVLLKKYKLPVFANKDTLSAIRLRAELLEECCRILPDNMELGGVKVETFDISHDAAAPVGFNFFEGKFKCSVATDLGFVTPTVRQALRLSDILVFGANHDLDMLQTGKYP